LAQDAAVRLVQSGALSVDDEHGRAIAQAREQQESTTGESGAARATWDSQAALLGLRDRLLREQLALQARRDAVEAERERMQAQAAELNRGGAVYDGELVRVCEELGGELLAARFEDLDPAQASWVQARLGPWVEALVVDDVDAAAAQLGKLEHGRRDVH